MGLGRVYVDGGRLISDFLAEGLIDDLVLTKVPVLLGDGLPLFHPIGVSTAAAARERSELAQRLREPHLLPSTAAR